MSTEARRIQIILELLRRHPATSAAGLPARVGVSGLDDCAVIPISPTVDLVIGSDFVRGEGFHLFQCGILSQRDIGYYLVAANASDLAAMGAAPLGIVVVLRYRPDMTDDEFEQTMDGVTQACADFSLPLLGGDTGGYERSVLSASAFGTCPTGRALLRSQGAVGDHLFLTGAVGAAGSALAYFMRGRDNGVRLAPEIENDLANAWRHICPAIDQGRALVESSLSKCAIDTSDGLKAACRQLAEASKVDAILFAEKIPISPLARLVAEQLGVDELALAVGDSVDFRLLFSVPENDVARLHDEFHARGWDLFEIGRLDAAAGAPGAFLRSDDGGVIPLPGIEWAQADVLTIDALRASGVEKSE